MFDGQRVVLESGMGIGQGRIPGVAGLGEEAKVGKHKAFRQTGICGYYRPLLCPSPILMKNQGCEEQTAESYEGKKDSGFPHPGEP